MKYIFMSLILGTSLFASSCGDSKKDLKAEYAGADISKNASIVRAKESKAASLEIYTKGKWALYAGQTVESIDFSKPVAEGTDSGVFPIEVSDSVRSYFQLVTEEGKCILADRHLPMTGGFNFRDLGGYKTQDGKFVKWGKIFRSDDLHKLTDADLHYLASMPLVSIVDFRSQEEVELGADKNPVSVKKNYAYSINPGNLQDIVTHQMATLTEQRADDLMKDMNVHLVTDSACIKRYKDFFSLLSEGGNMPLMYHCSAGKDRTGMATALVLASLGVDEPTIMQDYLLSNIYLSNKYAKIKAEKPILKSLLEVKAEFIQAGLDRIKQDHGSIENYLTKVLGVDIAKLRSLYLDSPSQ